MNLKNQPKESAYVKLILPLSLLSYKSARRNNQAAVTSSQGDRTTCLKSSVFNAILWIVSSGAAWRDLPPHFGNWNSIYHKFRLWCADDIFENILQALIADTEKYLLVEIDSTFCKVHQHAAGARKKHGNQAIGVSRGGKTTKIHALVTENFQLIGLLDS